MRNLTRAKWVLLSIMFGAGCGGALMEGCGGDDAGPKDDSIIHPVPDGTVDGRVDGNSLDTGADSGADATQPSDGSVDGISPDTSADAAQDANIQDAATQFDVGAPNLASYVDQVTRLYCLKTATCCGASFDVDRCIVHYETVPGPDAVMNLPARPYLNGGNMKLAVDKAQKCFDDINALTCGQAAGSNALEQTYEDCLAGAVGTIPVGETGCKGSPECVPNAHCELDAGVMANGKTTGSCVAPHPIGMGCPPGNIDDAGARRDGAPGLFYESQAQCGYLMSGNPGYCANYDTNAGWVNRGTTPNRCAQQVAAGQPCYTDVECQTLFCQGENVDSNGNLQPGTCSAGALFGTPSICALNAR